MLALDNDRDTTEFKKQILLKLKSYTNKKVPVYHFLEKCIDDTVRSRCILKEIGDLILSNKDEMNLFMDEYLASREMLNYYQCVYQPSLK